MGAVGLRLCMLVHLPPLIMVTAFTLREQGLFSEAGQMLVDEVAICGYILPKAGVRFRTMLAAGGFGLVLLSHGVRIVHICGLLDKR